jgi:MFS family permease
MWSTGIGMTASVFGPSERGKAFAYYGFGGTIALCLGPFVGGLLTEVASWRWIFFINLPIVAGVIAVMAVAWREPDRTALKAPFDYRGLALSALILVPLVLGLMQGPDWGWDSASVLALLAIAAIALPVFAWLELRAAAPLIDVRLLRQKTVVASNVALAAAQFSKMSVIVFGALFLQDRLGMSPLEAGAALLAATAAVALGLVPSGRLTDKHGPRWPTLLGVTGMLIGLVWLAIFVPEKSYPLLLPGFVLWGASLPFFFTPPRSATMNIVPEEKHDEAGGVMTTSQMLGGTLGISVLGAVLVDSGSFAAIFAVTAGLTALAWLVCFPLMQRPEPHHKRVPPVA